MFGLDKEIQILLSFFLGLLSRDLQDTLAQQEYRDQKDHVV